MIWTPSVPVYFADVDNFGDQLNVVLFRKYGLKVISTTSDDALVSAVGSVLGWLDGRSFRGIVLGSGLISKEQYFDDSKCDVRLLRGPLTRERLATRPDVPYGDLGLLAPMLVPARNTDAGRVAIVPHYADKNDPVVPELLHRVKGSFLVDATAPPATVLKQIASASRVISSSLHGLIAADAYGIPSICLRIGDKLIGGSFKFHDYMEGVQCLRPVREVLDLSRGNSLDRLYYHPDSNKIAAKQGELQALLRRAIPSILGLKARRAVASVYGK